MNVANIKTAPEGLTVIRDGNPILLREGDALRWGDKLINNGNTQIVVSIPAQNENQTSTELTMEPGAQSQLIEKDTPYNDGSSRTEVIAMTDGVELYDVDQEVTTTYGLVGAGLLAAGSGLGAGALAAGAGAGALGAALLLDDDEDNNDNVNNDDNPTPNPPPPAPSPAGDSTGLAGGADSLSQSLESTPLAPVALVTDGLSDGAETIGTGIEGQSEGDPSGITLLLSDIVGTPQQDYLNEQEGLVGLVSNVSDGIDSGSEGSQLDPILDPLAQTTNEVADALADIGNTLERDSSQLSPITSDLLSPVIGTDDQSGATGLEGTLSEVGDGLTDLTSEGSALEPLDPVTTAIDEQLLNEVESGLSDLGDVIVDGSDQAGEGDELLDTVSSITSIANGEDLTSTLTGGLG